MPIVAAAVLPHTPLLIPGVGKDHGELLTLTKRSIAEVVEMGYAAKPDLMVVLTPHHETITDTIVVNVAERYHGGFAEFGDMSTVVTARGAVGYSHQLKTVAEQEHVSLVLHTYSELDYGTSVPLTFVLSPLPNVPVLPVILPFQQTDILLRAGMVLYDFLQAISARSMIIASCDMSRRSDRTPGVQRRPTTEERALSQAIVAVDPAPAIAITPHPTTCGFGPLVTLLSVIHPIAQHGTILSFEAPLGVGLLTAIFTLR